MQIPALPPPKNLVGAMLALAFAGCSELAIPKRTADGDQIRITAQSGSEVVMNKYVGADSPKPAAGATPPRSPKAAGPLSDKDLDALLLPLSADKPQAPRLEARSSAPSPAAPKPPPKPAVPKPAPAAKPPGPLGGVRRLPWHVRPGETLFKTVTRFAERAGHSAQKAEPFPVWEITVAASYSGDFRGALDWLMAGFAHADPRPVLRLHPNRILRLSAE